MTPDIEKRQKFYSHLKVYLIVVGLVLFFSAKNGTYLHVRPWMVLWGLGVAAHYFGVFGGGCSRRGCSNRAEPFDDPKMKKDDWKDSDLV